MTNKQKKSDDVARKLGRGQRVTKDGDVIYGRPYRVCHLLRLLPLYVVHVPMYFKYTMTKGSALWFCLHTYLKGKREKRYINGKVKAP